MTIWYINACTQILPDLLRTLLPCVSLNQAVDWWSLGILVFELMTSDTPWECYPWPVAELHANESMGSTLDFVMFATVSIHNCLLHINMLKEHDDVEIFASHFLRTSDPFELGTSELLHWKFPPSIGMDSTCESGKCLGMNSSSQCHGGVGYTRNNIFLPTDSKHMAPIPSENIAENQR